LTTSIQFEAFTILLFRFFNPIFGFYQSGLSSLCKGFPLNPLLDDEIHDLETTTQAEFRQENEVWIGPSAAATANDTDCNSVYLLAGYS